MELVINKMNILILRKIALSYKLINHELIFNISSKLNYYIGDPLVFGVFI